MVLENAQKSILPQIGNCNEWLTGLEEGGYAKIKMRTGESMTVTLEGKESWPTDHPPEMHCLGHSYSLCYSLINDTFDL